MRLLPQLPQLPQRASRAWWTLLIVSQLALGAVAAPLEATIYGVPVAWALGLVLLTSAAVVVAPLHPWPGIIAFTLGTVMMRMLVPPAIGAPWPWSVTSMISVVILIVLVTLGHGWRTGLWSLVVPALMISLPALILGQGFEALVSIIVALSIALSAYLAAVVVGEGRDVLGQLSRERNRALVEYDRRLRVEERQRIARELHDVVAHGLSLIQVQAISARYRLSGLSDEAGAEFDEIAGAARGSLAEMRRLLEVLRDEESTVELTPQHGLEEIERLVADAERAGARIVLERAPLAENITSTVQLAVYRVAQEAISNAMRHSPGGDIHVALTMEGDQLALRVRNSAAGDPHQASSRPGHGLVGMRERIALLNGRLTTGVTEDGGYQVFAQVPLEEEGA